MTKEETLKKLQDLFKEHKEEIHQAGLSALLFGSIDIENKEAIRLALEKYKDSLKNLAKR
jgi:hypothetical protein